MKTIQTLWNTSLLASAIAIGISGGTVHAADVEKSFASPEAAAEALAAAARADDEKALGEILGVSWKDALSSGDASIDAAALKAFVVKYERMRRWTTLTDGTKVLHVGADNYPYPIPLAKGALGWQFDAPAGEREVEVRQIGSNELLALDAIDVISGAEEAYFAGAQDGEVAAYAQSIVSADGKRDGLFWTVAEADAPSPLAELGEVVADRSTLKDPLVLDGYAFRILDAQGASAKGGAKSYVASGVMSEGFAVIATPIAYGETGIMSFMRGSDGVVYEKDLGEDGAKTAASIKTYEPGDGWSVVD